MRDVIPHCHPAADSRKGEWRAGMAVRLLAKVTFPSWPRVHAVAGGHHPLHSSGRRPHRQVASLKISGSSSTCLTSHFSRFLGACQGSCRAWPSSSRFRRSCRSFNHIRVSPFDVGLWKVAAVICTISGTPRRGSTDPNGRASARRRLMDARNWKAELVIIIAPAVCLETVRVFPR